MVCPLCVPHQCHCGASVDALVLHGFIFKKALGRPALTDLVAWAMASAGIPVSKEPQGLSHSDGKQPDGLSVIPWQAGKPLTWDTGYTFQPISIEMLGPSNDSACDFLSNLGRKISLQSGDDREASFLYHDSLF